MTAYVALLRAVNVGGTGKLPMTTLVALCKRAGLTDVRTYIASGNVVFRSDAADADVRATLEAGLLAHAGKPVGVIVRTAAEMAEVAALNPFPDAPGNRVMALFVDAPLPADPFDGVRNARDEQIRLGPRVLYIRYPDKGTADSRLVVPAAKLGTMRNMNTVTKLVQMAAAA